MGELVKGKERGFFCEVCGSFSHDVFYCIMCEPPDTLREPPGPKWWGQPRRGVLARRHLTDEAIAALPPPQPRAKRGEQEEAPSPSETRILHRMMDAIREMLDLEPLYNKKPRGPNPPSFYDEKEGAWKQ